MSEARFSNGRLRLHFYKSVSVGDHFNFGQKTGCESFFQFIDIIEIVENENESGDG